MRNQTCAFLALVFVNSVLPSISVAATDGSRIVEVRVHAFDQKTVTVVSREAVFVLDRSKFPQKPIQTGSTLQVEVNGALKVFALPSSRK